MRFWACFASMWDLLLVCGGFGWNREVFGMSAFWVTLVIGVSNDAAFVHPCIRDIRPSYIVLFHFFESAFYVVLLTTPLLRIHALEA